MKKDSSWATIGKVSGCRCLSVGGLWITSKSVRAGRETSNVRALARRLGADWIDNYTQMVQVWFSALSRRKTKTHSHALCRVWPPLVGASFCQITFTVIITRSKPTLCLCFQSSEGKSVQEWDGGVCGGGGQAHGCFFEVFTENRLKQEKAQRGKFRKSVMLHYRMACSPPHNEGHVGSVIYLCSWNLFIHSTFLFGFTEKHWSTISCSSSNVQRGGGDSG